MAVQTINNGELLNVIRTKINQNFTEVELTGNKTQTISSTPSTTKYPTEKAVSDFASKIYSSTSIPTSKTGDLILHANAPISPGGAKGKIKYNASGVLSEFIPDRSVVDYRTSSAFSSANPILLQGELAVESDTGKQKIGNGSSPYNSLSFLSTSGTPDAITSGGTEENGWIRYPNGMITQWGLKTYMTDANGNFDIIVTLPLTFPSKRIYSHGVLETGTDWRDSQLLIHSRSYGNGAIRFICDSVVDQPLGQGFNYELHWIAVGF